MRVKLLLILFLLPLLVSAQKFLQIERSGSLKVKKLPIGGHFYFQLNGEKDVWYDGVIHDLYVGENIIQLENNSIPVDDISAIKFTDKDNHWAKSLSLKMYVFSGSWLTWSLLGLLTGEPLTKLTAIVVGGAIVLGTLVRWIFRPRIYKIGKRRRLRLMDLSFKISKLNILLKWNYKTAKQSDLNKLDQVNLQMKELKINNEVNSLASKISLTENIVL